MKTLKHTTYTLLIMCTLNIHAQDNTYKIHTIAFYNLENLFDTINDPNKFDEYSPIMALKSNQSEAYSLKIHNMAKVISDIGYADTKNTPSIIGVCEIENKTVLEDVVNDSLLRHKDYGIIHYDSSDARGIDVALLYQKKLFTPLNSSAHELKIYDDQSRKRVYTRDQLLVSGKLEDDLIHILVNHWPSRRGGEARSRPKRIAAAKLNKHLQDSLQLIDPYAKIFIMGDLNDNPNNASVKNILKPKSDKTKARLKDLYNPFIDFYKDGLGTTAYRDSWSLFDQIMMTKPLLEKDYQSYRFYKAGIFNKHYLIDQKGKYKGYPFRSWSSGAFSNGYSDHFPIYVYLIKEATK